MPPRFVSGAVALGLAAGVLTAAGATAAQRDGYWRAYFPGTSNFDRQKSLDDFVDVR
ncbi:hypothetical protein AB0C21_10675 [Spirillospora sp. NPDC049024]